MTHYTVGIMTGTHGLRGEVKVLSKTDFESERFRVGAKLFVRSPGETPFRQVEVRSARPHKQFWLLTFDGLTSIGDVEHWRGMELCVDDSQLLDLPEGTYYVHQLVGLHVQTETGRSLGILAEVLKPGANDVYVVRGAFKRDLLLPAIPDCVLHVDVERGVMTVHLMPGLLDDEEEDTP